MDVKLAELKQELDVKMGARRAYYISRGLSVISVPMFINYMFNLYLPGLSNYFMSAAIPAVFHIIILGVISTDKNPFIQNHTRQAMMIVGLRILSAFFVVIFLFEGPELLGFLLFLFGNGGLWWFGNRWGIRQVDEGNCWLISTFGNPDKLIMSDRSINTLRNEIAGYSELEQKRELPGQKSLNAENLPLPVFSDRSDLIAQAQSLIGAGIKKRGISLLAEAFRLGDRKTRAEAASALESLGLVEEF